MATLAPSSSSRSVSVKRSGMPATASSLRDDIPPGHFIWNGRQCQGTELHIAALDGNLAAAKAAIGSAASSLSAVKARFTYETIFNGKSQEGSGEAIHLAASRGHTDVAKLLLSHGADLNATVSRNHNPHYDVLHAAMFAEGRGGSLEMIQYLFEAKADMTRNQDGKYPLHIAFMTGNVPVIQLLRTFLTEKNISDSEYKDDKVPMPLELGITNGKMSEKQLSEAAEPSTLSLTVFINECPQCIPSFLKRMDELQHVSAVNFARSLTRFDLAKVLRESPEAAVALLAHTTDQPTCENIGWHPLPTRVSFARRNRIEGLREIFNPPRDALTFYEVEHVWTFDSQRFKHPDWHTTMCDRSFGRPIVDAVVRVCHVPDLLCAEVFGALLASTENRGVDDGFFVYEDDTISAAVNHLFWNGCCRVDLTQVLLTFWGLALLIAEEVFVSLMTYDDTGTFSRRLFSAAGAGPPGSPHMDQDQKRWGLALDMDESPQDTWVGPAFICAKGMVDIYLEYIRFRGYMSIGRTSDYFMSPSNMLELVKGLLPALLIFDNSNLVILVLSVFLYWIRLLGCFTSAQYIGVELLPIITLVSGLGPSAFMCSITFGAFTHAFYVVRGSNQALWPGIVMDSFATLITAALPESASAVSSLELMLSILAVAVFTIFILNIFIGVMSELYANARDTCDLQFRHTRASSCFTYLLRSRIIPCSICPTTVAQGIMVLATCAALLVQFSCFYDHNFRIWVYPAFLVCQLMIVVASYQIPEAPWVKNSHTSDQDHYVWFCKKVVKEEEDPVSAEIHGVLQEMDGVLAEIANLS